MTRQEKLDVAAVITALRELVQLGYTPDATLRAKVQAADAAAEDLLLRLNNEADTIVAPTLP